MKNNSKNIQYLKSSVLTTPNSSSYLEPENKNT